MTTPLLAPILFALQGAAGVSDCPAHEIVESRVRSILHLAPEQTLTESFVVERRAASLFVELRGEGSVIIGQRELPAEGSCDELAQAAAVVLSAWLTDVHPDFAGALPDAEPKPEPEPEPEPQPAPEPEPVAEPARRDPEPLPRPRDPSPPRGFQLGAALAVDVSSGGPAVGGGLHADYGFVDRGFGLTVFALATAARSAELGPGSVEWRRWPLGFGPRWRIGLEAVGLDVSVGPVASWLRLEGVGFDDNTTQSGIDWGGFASLRAFLRRPLSPFVAISAQVYPRTSTAFATDAASDAWDWPLPVVSFSLFLGGQLQL